VRVRVPRYSRGRTTAGDVLQEKFLQHAPTTHEGVGNSQSFSSCWITRYYRSFAGGIPDLICPERPRFQGTPLPIATRAADGGAGVCSNSPAGANKPLPRLDRGAECRRSVFWRRRTHSITSGSQQALDYLGKIFLVAGRYGAGGLADLSGGPWGPLTLTSAALDKLDPV